MANERLIEKLKEANTRLKFATSADEKIFLINYIDNLSDALIGMKEGASLPEKNTVSFDQYQLYAREMRNYRRKNMNQFFWNRDFHVSYFGNLLYHINEDYHSLPPFVESKENDGSYISNKTGYSLFISESSL